MKKHPTIFLIEDDVDDQEIFSIALEEGNVPANCIFANDGLHALEKIHGDQSFIPDFIFIDMNMPRMNGQQCLSEIKKIERLKHVPVFMYSTSVDPGTVEENKRLGAADFIVKPADINLLSAKLSSIVLNKIMPLVICMFCLNFISGDVYSQTEPDTVPTASELKKLSMEELMNIVVTSVSKSPENLKEVPSAIQVITHEQIQRSGAERLPEALRLATNLQVAQSGSHDWGISARGFNGYPVASSSLSNKLLVLIDGRSIYTPLFGGVFWDVQHVLMHDIQQIEVISGPGGSLWGANAVNGIINIQSKDARETQGWYAAGGIGSFKRDLGVIRYGSHIDSTFFFRVYGQRMDVNSSKPRSGYEPGDAWHMNQGGFRADFFPSSKNSFTLQGDAYEGKEDDTLSTMVNGQNIIGRWNHTIGEQAGLNIQLYVDRTRRNIQSSKTIDEMITYDLDFQHHFKIGGRNKLVWGFGYQVADDHIQTPQKEYVPERKSINLWNVFIQDKYEIIRRRLELTVGSKIVRSDYTDVEFQPTVRILYRPHQNHSVWAAVSKAVRTPSRIDVDLKAAVTLGSRDDFKSEKVYAYEFGYRVHPLSNLSLSLATYFNEYDDLRSVDTNLNPLPVYYFSNNLKAETYGFELAANYIATTWWELRGGYSYLHKTFEYTSPLTISQSDKLEAIDPQHQFLLQSMLDVTRKFQVDAVVRYVDVLPSAFDTPGVPSYVTFDVRLGWSYKFIALSVAGKNLAAPYHVESGTRKIPRSIFGKITLTL